MSVRTVLIVGGYGSFGGRLAQLLADRLQDAQLALLADVGHLVNVEAPAKFRQLVEEFLSGRPASKPDR